MSAQRASGKVFGGLEIEQNLKKEIRKIEGNVLRGMQVSLKLMEAEVKIITPVDTSLLINSIFSGAEQHGRTILGRIGFTARHAFFVHEMPSSTNWQKQGAEHKFLQNTVIRKISIFIENIRKFARR